MLIPAKRQILDGLERLGYVVLKRDEHDLLRQRAAAVVPVAPPSAAPEDGFEPGFEAFYRQLPARRPPRRHAYALRVACRYVIAAAIPGAFVEQGDGDTAGLVVIAAALRELGVDDRDLVLFDTSGDPTHGARRELSLWGAEGGGLRLLEPTGPARVDREAEPLPGELSATSYPPARIRIVRRLGAAATRAAAPTQLAFLAAGCSPHEANRLALRELLPRLAAGGVLAATGCRPSAGGRGNALSDELAARKVEVLLAPVSEAFRIGVLCRRIEAQSSAT